MRWQKEARIRIHGDRAEGEKYVSLARTLLGGLFERNHQIMEGGIAPRVIYDKHFVIGVFLQKGSSNETCFLETGFL
jgi:hypothetical protein